MKDVVAALVIASALGVLGCAGGEATEGEVAEGGAVASDSLSSCSDSKIAVVTDIDETLTIADEEFLPKQIQDGTYDPVEREGAHELFQRYAGAGFFILYLTARPETLIIESTGETAREITARWLDEHDFPRARSELVLAPEVVAGDTARAYKADALVMSESDGYEFMFAYGNADSDIAAYADADIAKDHTYIVGDLAGAEDTVPIESEGYTRHIEHHGPQIPAVCIP